MNYRRYIVFTFLWYTTTLFCVHAQEQFLQANLQYEQHNYEKAIELYTSIKRKGAATWHNLGNCYFYREEYVQAIACWKRAQKISSGPLWHTCDAQIQKAYQQLNSSPSLSRFTWLWQWQPSSTLPIQLALILCWYILFALGFTLKNRRWLRLSMQTLACSCLLFLGSSLAVRSYKEQKPEALIANAAPVFFGPHEQFDTITTAEIGKSVTILAENNDWYKISYLDGTGWIKKEQLIII